MSRSRFKTAISVWAALVLLAGLCGANDIPVKAYDTPSVSYVSAGLYSVTLRVQAGNSGAPQGFSVQWMKRVDCEAGGGWPANTNDSRIGRADFFGSPTLNQWGASTFQLGSGEVAYIQPGDLFDETGVATDPSSGDVLQPGTDYMIRVRALAGIGGASAFTGSLEAHTLSSECTQGFWKNHPESWPASCLPMLLGTVAYTKAQLLQIFGQPAQGNGLIALAHQLITTKLNVCNGSNPASVASAVAGADALIGNRVVPPIGAGSLHPSASSGLTQTLDDYNNGRLAGVADCTTMTRSSSWGALKVLYR